MTNFNQFDDAWAAIPLGKEGARKRAELTAAQFAALPMKNVPCGIFVLRLTDGSHKRFRIRLERGKWWCGARTISIDCKLGNEPVAEGEIPKEWETIALIRAHGIEMRHGFKHGYEARWALALVTILAGGTFEKYELAERDERCWLCMRELKTDAQRAAGLTPGCARKVTKSG